jgi:hypothetical protein
MSQSKRYIVVCTEDGCAECLVSDDFNLKKDAEKYARQKAMCMGDDYRDGINSSYEIFLCEIKDVWSSD